MPTHWPLFLWGLPGCQLYCWDLIFGYDVKMTTCQDPGGFLWEILYPPMTPSLGQPIGRAGPWGRQEKGLVQSGSSTSSLRMASLLAQSAGMTEGP
jgi:hypothetical protein